MTNRPTRRQGPPKLRTRAVVFGVLLVLFGVGMLLIGLSTGVTKTGLPPERHPELLVAREDLERVRERLERPPYSVWWERLQRYVESDLERNDRSVTGAKLAARAKALAFAYLMTSDRRYADRVAELLIRMPSHRRRAWWPTLDELIDGTADLAITYDLLACYLRSQESLDARVRLLLYSLGHELSVRGPLWPTSGKDTLQIRRLSALGLCALAIRDYPPARGRSGPRDWYPYARGEVLEVLRYQVARDGAWAEGPGRHFLAARVLLPFLIANFRVTGEQLISDRVLRACEWTVRIRMPNGLRPNLDSSALVPSCSYALVSLPQIPPHFHWDAQQTDLARTVPDDQLVEALCFYDDQVPSEAPPWPPSQVLEASGDIIFRSGWGPDSNYLLLRAERGQARTAGGAYEHADSTSLILCQGDEALVPDTGAGSRKADQTPRHPKAHSFVLVDHLAPPTKSVLGAAVSVDVDVTITDLVFNPQLSAARVMREYGGAVFERTVVFADQRDFIVFDRVTARKPRNFSWVLHLNAGGTTGGTLRMQRSRAYVERPRARLGVWLAASPPEAANLSCFDDVLYFTEGQPQTHAALEAVAQNATSASFLTLLSPRSKSKRLQPPSILRGNGWLGMRLASGTTALFRTDGTGVLSHGGFASNGFALAWTPTSDETREARCVLILGGSQLWIGEHLRWRASDARSVVWCPPRPTQPSQRSDSP